MGTGAIAATSIPDANGKMAPSFPNLHGYF